MADLKNSRNTQLNGSTTTIRTVSNQKSVTVTSPTAVVNYDSTGTLIPNQTLEITAIKFNTVAPVKWSTSNSGVKLYDANNAEITTDSGTSDTSVVYIRPAEFNTAGLSSLRVSASITDIDEISGYVTFIKLQASPGSSTFTASLYLQSANYPAGTPPAAPTGGTFNFTNSVLTPPAAPSGTTADNWWKATQPATSTTPTWACEYNFTGTSSQTVTAATWQNVRIDTVTGTAGTRTAILDLYKWSATAPNVNTASAWPTGTSVYTWATAQFAAKTTPTFVYNSWVPTPGTPVAGQTLYLARQVYVDTGSSSTSDVIWTTRTAIPISSAGTNGSRTGVLEVYKWSTSQPSNSSPNTTFPEGTSTYTWSTGEFGLPVIANGWSLLPGAAIAGSTLWATRILIVNTTTSNTTVGTWPATNTSYAVGAAGIGGTSANRVELYWQNATAPALPTKTRYTFSSDTVSILSDGSLGNWSRTKPNSTTIPTWMTTCAFSVVAPADSQDNSNWTTPVIVAQNGTDGTPGVNGTKALPVSAFLWSTIVPTSYSQDAILDWTNNSIDKYPTGWSSSAGAAPGPTGYVLYQITVTVTADASATSTAFNWSAASRNSIGYREDGTVGAQGDSARTAYLVTTSGTAPGAVTAVKGDVVPTSDAGTWSFSATSNLNAGEYMYQVDGIYSKSSNITAWGNPYLSNLKVGTLSAITANVGNLTVAEQGNIRTYGKDFGEAGGFFIGFNGTTNQFSIGDKLTYSGTTFKVGGVTINATTGALEGIGTGSGTIVNNDSARPGGVNLVGNSGFLRHNNVLPTNWFLYNNSSIAATTSVQSGGMFGQNYVRIIAGAATPTTLGIAVVSGIADSVKSWEPLQTYCISFWAKASAGALGKSMYGFYSNMGFTNGAELENPALTSSWQRYVFRGVPLSNANTSKGELYISVVQQGSATPLPSGSVIDICCPKVELGTQPSSWTPSPQDIMNINLEPSISAAQSAADAAAVVANTATSNADAAKASAATAVQAIADISSDSLLTPDEKPQIIQDYEVIIAEKAGINAQAANYNVIAQNTAYNKTISDLTDYLATLNSPSAWNNLYGNTTIVGETFRTNFKNVYTARQALLDVISGAAKVLSDAAQYTANAQSTTTFVGRGVTVNGKTLTKTNEVDDWNSDVYSKDSFVGGAYAVVKATSNKTDIMFGLNSDPETNRTWVSIDYALYLEGRGKLYDYRSGTYYAEIGTYVEGDILAVTYDGVAVRYLKNGTVIGTPVTTNITTSLFFDSSFYQTGSSLTNVQFGPLTNIGGIKINADGSLAGAGGGQVTIRGIGYNGDLNATSGKSLALPFSQWSLNEQVLTTVTDGKVGSQILKLYGGGAGYPNMSIYVPIDRSKVYRTRFWARPSASTTGLLYFSLRQFKDAVGTTGPDNNGRSPYKPSGVSRATHEAAAGGSYKWLEYSYTWSSEDWQTGVNFVQPEFLDNYSGSPGWWEIQDFSFEEVTEVFNAQTAAAAAKTAADSKLSKSAADTMVGPITLTAPTAITVGTPALDSVTGKNGFYIGSTGIVATKNGKATVSISNAGEAIFSGSLSAASGNFTGAVYGGSYTSSYAWPAAGGTGFYLGASGLLFGTANGTNAKYFQITGEGNVYAPGFSIENGSASFSGTLSSAIVNTDQIVGGAASTAATGYSQATDAYDGVIVQAYTAAQITKATVTLTVTVPAGASAILIDYYLGPPTAVAFTSSSGTGKDSSGGVTGYVTGPLLESLTDNGTPCNAIILSPAQGTHTFKLKRSYFQGTARLSVLILKR
jgi:hypothetical protein